MALYLGLDGGGSRLRARVEEGEGRCLLAAESGPANWTSTPLPILLGNVAAAVRGCPRVSVAVAALAGAATLKQQEDATSALATLIPADRLQVVPDYYAAWASCEQAHICVLAGTGSLVCSQLEGKIVKSGGGGLLFGDEGSAGAIGRRALSLWSRGRLSRPLAALLALLTRATDADEAIADIFNAPSPPARLAEIGISLARSAEGWEIVQPEIEALASLTRHHLLTYHEGVRQPRIALSGGLWDAVPVAADVFGACVPSAGIIRPAQSSVQGAVRLARQLAHEHGE